jgi:hypothetical protein
LRYILLQTAAATLCLFCAAAAHAQTNLIVGNNGDATGGPGGLRIQTWDISVSTLVNTFPAGSVHANGWGVEVVGNIVFYSFGSGGSGSGSEPEVREAYSRIAANSLAIEATLRSEVKEQVRLAPERGQSVLVIPWYLRRDLADPRLLTAMRRELADGPFARYKANDSSYWESIANMTPYANGLSARVDPERSAGKAQFRFFITRFGIVHFAEAAVVTLEDRPYIDIWRLIVNQLSALEAARFVLSRCYYWGPVQIVQTLQVPYGAFAVMPFNQVYPMGHFGPGTVESLLPEVNLRERGDDLEPVARELCDQVFQCLGAATCPLFKEDGHLLDELRRHLPSTNRAE